MIAAAFYPKPVILRFSDFKTNEYAKLLGKGFTDHKNDSTQGSSQSYSRPCLTAEYQIIGYTKCDCNVEFKPGIVLDPFFGAGTVGVAAEQLGLQWCGIELNQEYIDIAKKRLEPYLNNKLEIFL